MAWDDICVLVEEIDRVVVEIDGKRNKREICGNNFHDNKKDRAAG
jgi:hypothetical protein